MKPITAYLLLALLITSSISMTIQFTTGNLVAESNQTNAVQPAENTWAEKTAMPTARCYPGSAAVGDKIFAIGGQIGIGVETVGTNEMYDPATDTWIQKAAMPTPRYLFSIAVYQNKIYCIGGTNFNSTTRDWQELNINEVYDPATNTWETKAPIPTATSEAGAAVADGKIYVIGGTANRAQNEAYDPATDTWTTKAPIEYTQTINYSTPTFNEILHFTPVDGTAAVATFGDNIFWFGTIYSKTKADSYLSTTLAYNPKNDSWNPLTPPPSGMDPYTAVVTSGVWAPKQIYVLGYKVNVAYNPSTDTWTREVQSSLQNTGFSAAAVNDQIYVMGGGYTHYILKGNQVAGLEWITSGAVKQYTPLGYGTVPPAIMVQSPQNNTGITDNPALRFSVNKPVVWIGYSIDGKDNITVTENATLSGLETGMHHLVVYARDNYGNTGASETSYFTLETPLQPLLLGIAAVTVAVGVAALVVYLKKKTRSTYEGRQV